MHLDADGRKFRYMTHTGQTVLQSCRREP
jgi:hypothetical protein